MRASTKTTFFFIFAATSAGLLAQGCSSSSSSKPDSGTAGTGTAGAAGATGSAGATAGSTGSAGATAGATGSAGATAGSTGSDAAAGTTSSDAAAGSIGSDASAGSTGSDADAAAGTTGSDAATDTNTSDAAADTAASDAGSACNTLVLPTGVPAHYLTAALPAPTGGTIVDGTYALTELNHYGSATASTGNDLIRSVIKFAGNAIEWANQAKTDPEARSAYTYVKGTSTLTLTKVCPTAGVSDGTPFTATATTFKLYLDAEYVFTKQP